MSETLAQTHVWHKGQRFFVSTINRECSATEGGIYAETLVWEWDAEVGGRGGLVGQDEAAMDSLAAHFRMVKRLFETGTSTEGG